MTAVRSPGRQPLPPSLAHAAVVALALAGPAQAMVPVRGGAGPSASTTVTPGPPVRFRATVLGGTPTIVVRGELPKEAIRRVFYVHLNEIKHCYQQELQHRPGLSGRMVVNFSIDGLGQVHDLTVPASTLGLPSLQRCIAEAVQRWEFPPQASPDGEAQTVVNYPFVLRPRVPDLPAVGVQVSDEELAALGVVKEPTPPAVEILF